MNDAVAVVQAKAVSRYFYAPDSGDKLMVLSDIDLTVHAGESVAIIGPSGAGKSTLLGLLAGLDLPDAGDVLLLGERLAGLDEDSRASLRAGRVGFVFQSFQLLPAFTALENVLLPLEMTGVGDARARAMRWLDAVELTQRVRHRPAQLSGGEQQRVALARAFAVQPAVLFADEPTGNLDRRSGRQVAEVLFQLQRRQRTAVILVTHDTELAGRCDRQVRIVNGMLAAA